MPVPYPTLQGTESEDLYGLFSFINNGVDGVFMPIMLLVIWIVAFVGALSEGRQASRAFIFANFIAALLAMLLTLIGMLNSEYMYFSFLLVGAGIIWYKLDNAPGI